MRNIHPGEIVNMELLKENGLTVTAAARLLGVTRTTLSNIINGKSDLSPEMCYRIAGVFGGTADIWANLQTKYNLRAVAEKAKSLKITPYQPGKTA